MSDPYRPKVIGATETEVIPDGFFLHVDKKGIRRLIKRSPNVNYDQYGRPQGVVTPPKTCGGCGKRIKREDA